MQDEDQIPEPYSDEHMCPLLAHVLNAPIFEESQRFIHCRHARFFRDLQLIWRRVDHPSKPKEAFFYPPALVAWQGL